MTSPDSPASPSCRGLLVAFLKERTGSYALGFFFLTLTNLLLLTFPKILGVITDLVAEGKGDSPELPWALVALVALAVVMFGTRFLWRRYLIGNARRLEMYLRGHLFRHLQSLPVSFYTVRKTGELMSYAVNDVQALRMTLGMGLLQSVDGLMLAAISLSFMAGLVSVPLTVATLVPLVIAGGLTVVLARPIRSRFREVQESFARISDRIQETLGGIRVLKAFAQEAPAIEALKRAGDDRVKIQQRLTAASALLGPVVQAFSGVSFLILIVFGSHLVHEGALSVGDFVATNLYLGTLMGPVMNLSRIIEVFQKGVASFHRLDELFAETPAPGQPTAGVSPRLEGRVTVRNLSFRYPGAEVDALSDVHLELVPGKLLGIVGATGSGKTTLVSLLLRLHPVADGTIFIDGVDINDWSLADLRESVGYVPQDHFLFSTTIRSNIEFFRPDYSDEEIEEASRRSGILEAIAAFPDGFETEVGERGVTLSGGQKQRIGIARALVKDPGLLILDDCLSAVDAPTEHQVLASLRSYLTTRTGIVISHRVSAVATADEVIVLDGGRIVERGAPADLARGSGPYARLCRAQGGAS